MKKTLILASFVALAFVGGCASSNKTDDSGSMGVVGESKKGGCCSQKSECTTDKPAEGSMGVMSEKKSCEGKTGCSSDAKAAAGTCPMSGKQN